MGISKQDKHSPTDCVITWLGFALDTPEYTLAISEDKQNALLQSLHSAFMKEGLWLKTVNSKVLNKLLGTLCHFSQTSPLGKMLLLPLYERLKTHQGFTLKGRPVILWYWQCGWIRADIGQLGVVGLIT